jgi:hypothetical protein
MLDPGLPIKRSSRISLPDLSEMLIYMPPPKPPRQPTSWSPSAGTRRFLRIVAHPVPLALASVLSVFLWMPFGIGYYEWPWQNRLGRWLLEAFVFALPISALIACVLSIVPRFSAGRLTLALLSLVIGMFGVFAMLHWINVFVTPLLERQQ